MVSANREPMKPSTKLCRIVELPALFCTSTRVRISTFVSDSFVFASVTVQPEDHEVDNSVGEGKNTSVTIRWEWGREKLTEALCALAKPHAPVEIVHCDNLLALRAVEAART